MILKDIADITGYDISTISRVSNSKYIQTEFGVYPVKYFFSESMTNDAGEEVSTREIKKILEDCIDNENHHLLEMDNVQEMSVDYYRTKNHQKPYLVNLMAILSICRYSNQYDFHIQFLLVVEFS
jgi:hypothetical protein